MDSLDFQKDLISNQYQMMCEAVAHDIVFNTGDTYPFDFPEQVAKDTIKYIKESHFLSDFEKTVRDYFTMNNLELNYKTIADDITKYCNKLNENLI